MKYAFCSTIGGKRHALIVKDSLGLKIALFFKRAMFGSGQKLSLCGPGTTD